MEHDYSRHGRDSGFLESIDRLGQNVEIPDHRRGIVPGPRVVANESNAHFTISELDTARNHRQHVVYPLTVTDEIDAVVGAQRLLYVPDPEFISLLDNNRENELLY